jgi:FkbM family methyltransferase
MWSLLEFFPEDFLINVLDVGAAFIERPPYQSLVDVGRARIIGFEPDQQACENLNRKYGDPHRFFPFFIGNGGPATFHETNWAPTGSLYEPNTRLLEKFQNLAELVTPVSAHTVSTTRLDDIEEISDVDFIKIDVQGSELVVFENASRALASALVIQTEVEFVEIYKGQPMFADVDTFLRASGFQFHTLNGFSGRAFKPLVANGDLNSAFRQALWSDAIYVRDWMRLEELSEARLRNYAILAHDVLRSYDLAHVVLSALDSRTGGRHAADYLQRLVGSNSTS